MTDEDRYCKLGTGFQAVRGILCSPTTQGEAAAAVATYIAKQLYKEFDLKKGYDSARSVVEFGNGLFGDAAACKEVDRMASDSQAAEHFAEAFQRTLDAGERAETILDHLASIAVAGTKGKARLQRKYRDDAECQAAFAQHEESINEALIAQLREKCGIEGAPRHRAEREDQAALLEFVVVKSE